MNRQYYRKHFLCIVILSLGISWMLFAQSGESKVFDDANLFTAEETADLNRTALSLINETGVDLVIVTTNSTGSRNSMEYADDYFDYNHFGIGPNRDGMLILINMQARDVRISTHGAALGYFRDADIEKLLDKIVKPLSNGNFNGAAEAFLYNSAGVINKKIADAQYAELKGFARFTPKLLGRSMLFGFLLALLVTGIMALAQGGKLPSVSGAHAYINEDKIDRKSVV